MLVDVGDDDKFVGSGFLASSAMPLRTVSGEPTMERASIRIACAFSVGVQ